MSSNQMNMWKQMPKGLKTAVLVGLGIVVFIALALVFGWVVQALWNATVADMFGWPEISYWQAIGIFFLAKLFFGFGIGGGNKSSARKKKTRQKSVVPEPAADTLAGLEDLSDLPNDEDFKKFWAAEGKAAWNAFQRGA